MTYVIVDVTEEDIRLGLSDVISARTCPLARGLHHSGYPDALVSPRTWALNGNFAPHAALTKKALRFVNDVDHGYAVRPTRFRLKVPE